MGCQTVVVDDARHALRVEKQRVDQLKLGHRLGAEDSSQPSGPVVQLGDLGGLRRWRIDQVAAQHELVA
jgi:hypothetical protein